MFRSGKRQHTASGGSHAIRNRHRVAVKTKLDSVLSEGTGWEERTEREKGAVRRVGRGRGALPQRGLAAQARVNRAVRDQRGMGDRENLSQHGGHAGMTRLTNLQTKPLRCLSPFLF